MPEASETVGCALEGKVNDEQEREIGGEAGIRILRTRLSNLVMTRDFWF
jgi:hypothetical protein